MTGDSRPPAPEGGWGLRIGAFERHFSGWKIESDGARYSARRKVGGRAKGRRLTAPDLDALAARIDAAEGNMQ